MLKLSTEEQRMANGDQGPVHAFAMELLIDAAGLCGARSFCSIEAAYIGTALATIRPHTDLVEWVVSEGAKVAVPTFTNVGIHDPDNWGLRSSVEGESAQRESKHSAQLHQRLGCQLAATCSPYYLPGCPQFGAHVACSESNAVSYFNSVLGVRTAKYGDYLDLAAALTGRVPWCGLHTDKGRRAQRVFNVAPLPPALNSQQLGYHLIGHAMGRRAGVHIPVLSGINPKATTTDLRALGACGASAGGVAMFHVAGLTPEAPTVDAALGGCDPLAVQDLGLRELAEARAELTHFDEGAIDAVVLGTPHAALDEVQALAVRIDGRRVNENVVCYVQMSRFVFECAKHKGWIAALERAGVKPVVDTCIYWRPVASGLEGRIVTNSGKYAYYAPGELGVETAIGSLDECVESAVSGRVWRDPALEIRL